MHEIANARGMRFSAQPCSWRWRRASWPGSFRSDHGLGDRRSAACPLPGGRRGPKPVRDCLPAARLRAVRARGPRYASPGGSHRAARGWRRLPVRSEPDVSRGTRRDRGPGAVLRQRRRCWGMQRSSRWRLWRSCASMRSRRCGQRTAPNARPTVLRFLAGYRAFGDCVEVGRSRPLLPFVSTRATRTRPPVAIAVRRHRQTQPEPRRAVVRVDAAAGEGARRAPGRDPRRSGWRDSAPLPTRSRTGCNA